MVSFLILRPFDRLRAGKDEHFAITCSDDKTVRLWDVRTGKQHRKFVGHQDLRVRVFCPSDLDAVLLWII